MTIDVALRSAYALNILILVPVLFMMLGKRSGPAMAAFEGKLPESAGLRLLVSSLWFAILASSVAGLAWPRAFWPILLLQVIYKATYLVIFVWPTVRENGLRAAPWGVSLSFLVIVAVWPWILLFLWRTAGS